MKNLLAAALLSATALCAPFAPSSNAADSALAAIVEESGTGWMIGTWQFVEPQSGLPLVEITFAWALDKQAITLDMTSPERTAKSMITIHPKSGDVRHFSADSLGAVAEGVWQADAGEAVLTITMTEANGDVKRAQIVHKKIDDSSMEVTMTKVDDEGNTAEEADWTVKLTRKAK
jgi:hypothetical protein